MNLEIETDLIPQEDMDDVIAEGIYNRQREFANYKMELQNVEYALSVAPDDMKEHYQTQINFIKQQMQIVVNFHNGLKSQIRSPEAHAAALARTAAKRAAAQNA